MTCEEQDTGSREVVGNAGLKNGIPYDLLEVLKSVFSNVDSDSGMWISRGMTLPRPWSPKGVDDSVCGLGN